MNFNKEHNITPTPLIKKITGNSILDLVSRKNNSKIGANTKLDTLGVPVEIAIAVELGIDEGDHMDKNKHIVDGSAGIQPKTGEKGYSEHVVVSCLADVVNASNVTKSGSVTSVVRQHDPLLGSVRRQCGAGDAFVTIKNRSSSHTSPAAAFCDSATNEGNSLLGARSRTRVRRTRKRGTSALGSRSRKKVGDAIQEKKDRMVSETRKKGDVIADGKEPAAIVAEMAQQLLKGFEAL